MKLLLDELVGDVERGAAAVGARVGTKRVLLGFEMRGNRLATGRLRRRLRLLGLGGLLWYLAWAFERLGTHRDAFGLAVDEMTPAAFKKSLG